MTSTASALASSTARLGSSPASPGRRWSSPPTTPGWSVSGCSTYSLAQRVGRSRPAPAEWASDPPAGARADRDPTAGGGGVPAARGGRRALRSRRQRRRFRRAHRAGRVAHRRGGDRDRAGDPPAQRRRGARHPAPGGRRRRWPDPRRRRRPDHNRSALIRLTDLEDSSAEEVEDRLRTAPLEAHHGRPTRDGQDDGRGHAAACPAVRLDPAGVAPRRGHGRGCDQACVPPRDRRRHRTVPRRGRLRRSTTLTLRAGPANGTGPGWTGCSARSRPSWADPAVRRRPGRLCCAWVVRVLPAATEE